MRKLLSIFLCLGLAGCATNKALTQQYVSLYNEAVASGHSVVIVKEGDFETTKDGVEQQLGSVGYNKNLYASPIEPFVVLGKGIAYGSPMLNGDSQAHKIFLKYTRIDAGHTRIDLVNGAQQPSIRDEVDTDIQKLADLIKNS